MNNLFKSLLASALLLPFINMSAQGWPENYEGVMLQGFYWDSYNDTKWTNLENQSDELSDYFDLIWIPNSANSDGGMGYMPVYWFTNYNSAFGNEAQLRSMIKTFAEKGTGIIADVVINHRNGLNSWYDFPAEIYNGKTYDMTDGSIVSNDNVWSHPESGCPDSYKGNADTGDRFDGCRDLDHTNPTVQEHIIAYTTFLLEDLGYTGFRYDMVKGYAPQYTKLYNESSKPQFSVGEFWDSSYDAVQWWIEGTGRTSAAFDFPCKYQINSAFSNGLHLKNLVWYANGTNPQPAGMIHYGYPQYAVTFVDNHDTYRDNNKFTDNDHVLAANAFILSSPGTPCVFLPHYKAYKAEIQEMINARKSAGISNTSTVTVLKTTDDCYMAEIKGSRGVLAVKIGDSWDTPQGYTENDIYTFGNDYCIWVKSDGSYVTPPVSTPEEENNITIYYDNTATQFNPVYCYSFANDGDNTMYSWPGHEMKYVEGNIYSVSLPEGSSVVFNSKGSSQTVDVLDVEDGYIYIGLSTKNSSGKYLVENGGILEVDPSIPTGALYLQGNFDTYTGDWDPTMAKLMDKEPGHFVIRNVKMNGSSGYAYFSFSDRIGDWEYVNEGTRYGSDADGQETSAISNPQISTPAYKMHSGWTNAWKVINGNYDFVVDPSTWNLTVYTAGNSPSFVVTDTPGEETPDSTGIENIETNQSVVYFNLQGLKVENPSKGIFIKVSGDKREKVILK